MKVLNLTKFVLMLMLFSVFVSGQGKKETLTDKQFLLNAGVTDYEGKIVKGLKKENFRLYENNKPMEISYFSDENSPMSVGFLIDASRAMGVGIDWCRESALAFIEKSNSENEYFTTAFSKEVNLVLDFADAAETEKIISASPYFTNTPKRGQTALYEAIKSGIENLSKAKNRRRVLFILSSGSSNYSSSVDYKEVEKLVRERNITVYPVNCRASYPGDGIYLTELAEISGAKLFYLGNKEPIEYDSKFYSNREYFKLRFSKLAEQMQNQYVIGFKPNLESKDNKWRKLEIKLEIQKELRKQINAPSVNHRKGYYPLSEAATSN